MTFEAEVVWHEEFGGALPAETFSRPSVELPSDGIELSLREVGQVGAFREILAQQAMGVLVDAALPRAVRIGEIDGDAGHFGKAFVLGHFAPLIVGHGKAALSLDPVENRAESGDGGFGGCIFHLGQSDEQRGALDQGADGGSVASTFDEIALPMPASLAQPASPTPSVTVSAASIRRR